MNTKHFRARPGCPVDLAKWPTRVTPLCGSKDEYQRVLEKHVAELSAQQQLLYASDRHALLLIFQGMDSAGKDGMIRHVMYGVNPQGCEVFSFQPPNPEELKHDFLWRAARRLPERGRIGIFNRSYYEEVLVVRVHPELLEEETPAGPHARGSKLWELRYRSIVDFERHLSANGTHIVKFFLHLSRAEQRRRFLARIDEPGKNWKFSGADIHERAYWKQYMKAYGQCLGDTSSRHAPWHIVPADSKDDARVIVSRVIVERLRDLKMTYPKLDPARRRILRSIRKQLER